MFLHNAIHLGKSAREWLTIRNGNKERKRLVMIFKGCLTKSLKRPCQEESHEQAQGWIRDWL